MHTFAGLQQEEYKQLIKATLQGKDFSKLPQTHPARAYKSPSNRISISTTGTTGMGMLNSTRIFVPPNAVDKIIKYVQKMYKTAVLLYFWPGMKNTIKQAVDSCTACREDRPKQARPTTNITPPSEAAEPMRHVETDLFDAVRKKWIVLVDRYSG